jgi:hypothetical protein
VCYTLDVKRRPRKDPDLPMPDCSDIEHFHELCASGRLTEILDNIAGLGDARDPDPTALLNAVNPPSRAVH